MYTIVLFEIIHKKSIHAILHFSRGFSSWLCIKPGIQERGTECAVHGEGGNVIFQEMSTNIPGNEGKYSEECRQTFREILSESPGNVAKFFQSTCVIEIGLSDFYRMTISVFKMHFHKLPPKVIGHRDFKKFVLRNL